MDVFPSSSNALHMDSGLCCSFEDCGDFAIYFCIKNKMLNTEQESDWLLTETLSAKGNHPRLSVQGLSLTQVMWVWKSLHVGN